MALFSRVLAPNLDRGATVENAGVAPHSAAEEDVAALDARLVELLHPEAPAEEAPRTAPRAAPVRSAVRPGP